MVLLCHKRLHEVTNPPSQSKYEPVNMCDEWQAYSKSHKPQIQRMLCMISFLHKSIATLLHLLVIKTYTLAKHTNNPALKCDTDTPDCVNLYVDLDCKGIVRVCVESQIKRS